MHAYDSLNSFAGVASSVLWAFDFHEFIFTGTPRTDKRFVFTDFQDIGPADF
jgi:hypothetical protein